MILNTNSRRRLIGVHPDLVRVVQTAAAKWQDKTLEWVVTCGVRTVEEQKLLIAKGASKTMRSRHIPARNGFSHAVDLAPVIEGKARWDWPLFDKLAKAMKAAAAAEKVPLEWGGDWETFKDGPHFQLPWVTYPGNK